MNSIWNFESNDHVFLDTPDFCQRLIGANPLINLRTSHDLATGIELETLVTYSDGSFNPDSGKGSLGWIVSTTDQKILAKGAGPVDGHPSLMSSYRSELDGLITILYTLYRICKYHQVTDGKIKYHCDNKGVI
jgi:hypothetical protein